MQQWTWSILKSKKDCQIAHKLQCLRYAFQFDTTMTGRDSGSITPFRSGTGTRWRDEHSVWTKKESHEEYGHLGDGYRHVVEARYGWQQVYGCSVTIIETDRAGEWGLDCKEWNERKEESGTAERACGVAEVVVKSILMQQNLPIGTPALVHDTKVKGSSIKPDDFKEQVVVELPEVIERVSQAEAPGKCTSR